MKSENGSLMRIRSQTGLFDVEALLVIKGKQLEFSKHDTQFEFLPFADPGNQGIQNELSVLRFAVFKLSYQLVSIKFTR